MCYGAGVCWPLTRFQAPRVKVSSEGAIIEEGSSEGASVEEVSSEGKLQEVATYAPWDGNLQQPPSRIASAMRLVHGVVICWQIITGVAFMHSNGIMHGDIKPANVLLDLWLLQLSSSSSASSRADPWFIRAALCDLDFARVFGADWSSGAGTAGFQPLVTMGVHPSKRVLACALLDLPAVAVTCLYLLMGTSGYGDQQFVLDPAAEKGVEVMQLSAQLGDIEGFVARMPVQMRPSTDAEAQLLCTLLKVLQVWLRLPKLQGADVQAQLAELQEQWVSAEQAAELLVDALQTVPKGCEYVAWLLSTHFPGRECCLVATPMCAFNVWPACLFLQSDAQLNWSCCGWCVFNIMGGFS